MRSSPERSSVAASGDQGPGAEHEAGLGEGQGPARRPMLAERQIRMFKTLDGAHAKTPLRSIQSRDGGCADGIVLSKTNIIHPYEAKL